MKVAQREHEIIGIAEDEGQVIVIWLYCQGHDQ